MVATEKRCPKAPIHSVHVHDCYRSTHVVQVSHSECPLMTEIAAQRRVADRWEGALNVVVRRYLKPAIHSWG